MARLNLDVDVLWTSTSQFVLKYLTLWVALKYNTRIFTSLAQG